MKKLPADFPQPPSEADDVARYIAWMFQVLMWLVARAAAGDEWWNDGNGGANILPPAQQTERSVPADRARQGGPAAEAAHGRESAGAPEPPNQKAMATRTASAPRQPAAIETSAQARREPARASPPPPPRTAPIGGSPLARSEQPRCALRQSRPASHPTVRAGPDPKIGPAPVASSHVQFVTIS